VFYDDVSECDYAPKIPMSVWFIQILNTLSESTGKFQSRINIHTCCKIRSNSDRRLATSKHTLNTCIDYSQTLRLPRIVMQSKLIFSYLICNFGSPSSVIC
jgi:hypothetical protein